MPANLIDLLRLGFPGLAAYFLYLSYKLSRQIIQIPDTRDINPQTIIEKRKALNLYGWLCVIALVLSIGAEICKNVIKPPLFWINATVHGQFSEEELKQRPLEVSTWWTEQSDKTFKSFQLSHQKPLQLSLPSSGGEVQISIPDSTEVPK